MGTAAESMIPARKAGDHMTPEEFAEHGRAVLDWVARYWAGLPRYRVTPAVAPGEVAGRMPARPPEQGEPFDALLADLDRVVLPGLAHWQHPGFLGYFPMTTSGPAVLADLISAGINAQGMLWATNPACTEVETVVCDWLAELMGMPGTFRGNGVIQDTASTGVLVAVLAALARRGGAQWREYGPDGRYTMYASSEAHCSVRKAARIAGIGEDRLRVIPVSATDLAMRPEALRERVETDLAAGFVPVAAVATIGTTSTTAVDPIREIGEVCRAHGLWLHVDAAYAGVAAICPEFRWIHEGLELADSYCVNPHKWLLTGFDCDVMWVADRAALNTAMSVSSSYLDNDATLSGAVTDFRDWQIPLGRRFRSLKLWFVLRWYGAEGLRAHLRSGVALAQRFAGWVADDDRFEIVAPHPFGLVCFRLRADDGANARLHKRLNDTGSLFLSHTHVDDRYTLRLAVGGPATTERHLAAAWDLIRAEATRLGTEMEITHVS